MTVVEELARLVTSFDAASLPPRVAEHTKLLLLDTIGCAIAATPEPACQAVIRAVEGMGSGSACTIIGFKSRTSAPDAVLANGGLIRILDLNDSYFGPHGLSGHPSDNIAVALAAAEQSGAPGRELLPAIVLGYEIDGRMSDLTPRGLPWDYPTRTRFIAPVMAGRLMGLDAERLTHALALSASAGPNMAIARQGHISAAKWLAGAMTGHSALAATMLAAAGLAGPRSVVEGPAGWDAVLPGIDLSQLAAPLEGSFRIETASIKAFPCVGTSQASVAAAIEVRQAIAGRAQDIERVDVRMADTQMVRSQLASAERRHPTSRESADHGFWFLIATALLDGEMTPRQFEDERWLKPEVIAMMDRIDIQPDASLNQYTPASYPAVVEVTLKSGEKRRAEVPYSPGHHMAGMTAEVVIEKFKRVTAGLISDGRQQEIVDGALGIEQAESVRPLMALLAG